MGNMPTAWKPLVHMVCADHLITHIYIFMSLCLDNVLISVFADSVIQPSSEDTVLHIYKRRMGLTKRGGYDNETLSVSSVSINQTDTFTWSETTSFVKLIIPTSLIQKTKVNELAFLKLIFFKLPNYHFVYLAINVFFFLLQKCADKEAENLQQSFFRIDAVLTFKETNNRMLWTMENTSPCSS